MTSSAEEEVEGEEEYSPTLAKGITGPEGGGGDEGGEDDGEYSEIECLNASSLTSGVWSA